MFRYATTTTTTIGGKAAAAAASSDFYTLQLSRASSIFMLIAYIAYIVFQLKTHRQLFEAQEVHVY